MHLLVLQQICIQDVLQRISTIHPLFRSLLVNKELFFQEKSLRMRITELKEDNVND